VLKNRPDFQSHLPGLYYCGVSTRAGHGIVGAMMSGYRCSQQVVQHDGKSLGDLFAT
jgi:phytoene dehydrogenase-like protein